VIKWIIIVLSFVCMCAIVVGSDEEPSDAIISGDPLKDGATKSIKYTFPRGEKIQWEVYNYSWSKDKRRVKLATPYKEWNYTLTPDGEFKLVSNCWLFGKPREKIKTKYTYNAKQQLIMKSTEAVKPQFTYPMANHVKYSYNKQGKLLTEVHDKGDKKVIVRCTYKRDGEFDVVTKKSKFGYNELVQTKKDKKGRIVHEDIERKEANGWITHTITKTIYENDRKVSESVSTTTTFPGGREIEDEEVKKYVYLKSGRLSKVEISDDSGEQKREIEYNY